MGVSIKIGGFAPNPWNFNRVLNHYFHHHPFWGEGFHPYFWKPTSIYIPEMASHMILLFNVANLDPDLDLAGGESALCSHLPRPTDRQSCEESRHHDVTWTWTWTFAGERWCCWSTGVLGLVWDSQAYWSILYMLDKFQYLHIWDYQMFACQFGMQPKLHPSFLRHKKKCIWKVPKWPFLWLDRWCLVQVWWELWATTTGGLNEMVQGAGLGDSDRKIDPQHMQDSGRNFLIKIWPNSTWIEELFFGQFHQ